MQSTFAPIELGKRGIIADTLALQTIGHNMSNAGVEGYSRQRVEMNASAPLYMPDLTRENSPGQVGQGVDVSSIERITDPLLQGRIFSQGNVEGYWDSRDKYILMLEQVYNEPTENSVRTLLDKFWESWQELSLRPTEMGARRAVLERGNALIGGIHDQNRRLTDIRDSLEGEVKATVTQVNELAREISSLNGEVVKAQAMGDHPNDLLDRRDILIGKLSSLVDISVTDRGSGELVISSSGMHMVQGLHHEELSVEPDRTNEGYSRVKWSTLGGDAAFRGGKLASLLELRDSDARGEIQKLDMMTENFIDMVNEVHRSGYSLNGETGNDFFVEYPFVLNAQGNYDSKGTGTFDSTYLFRVTGSNTLNPTDLIGLEGTITLPGAEKPVEVRYHPTDTVSDLITRINLSGAEAAARLNFDGKLTLKGVPAADSQNPDFVFRGVEDTGQFLVGYSGILKAPGPAGAYTWAKADAVESLQAKASYSVAPLSHPSGWIEVNPRLARDPGAVAAASAADGKSGGVGDGSIALSVAQLRTQTVMIGAASTFDNWFADRVTDIGLRGEEAQRSLDTVRLVMKELNDARESISGVNMDEELSKMIIYQRGYSAVARYITTFDSLLDVLINKMGV